MTRDRDTHTCVAEGRPLTTVANGEIQFKPGILARGARRRIVDNHLVVPEDGRPESRSQGGIQVSVAYADIFILITVTQILQQALGRDVDEPLQVDPLPGVIEILVVNNKVIGGEGHGISVQGVTGAPDRLLDLHVRGNQVAGHGWVGDPLQRGRVGA